MRSVERVIIRIRDLGVAGQPPATVRRIRTINLVSLVTIILTSFYALFYAFYDAELFYQEIIFLIVMIGLFSTVFLATRAGLIELAMWLLIVTALVQLGIVNWMLGPEAGALSYLLSTTFLTSLVVRVGDRFTIWPIAIVVTVIFFVVSLSDREVPFDTLPQTIKHVYLFATIAGAVILASGISLFFRWLIERAEAELQAEKARGDRLLRAILPEPIAEELKRDGRKVIADRFGSATVVFADIVGFTERAARTDADRIVSELNRVFSEADVLAERHGVEKIKTIGDAYFAVCGLPDPKPDHAARVADFALDLLAAAKELANSVWPGLQLRIVIHSGPVIAGVIGRTKFAYDVWGDTVNTAARMKEVCRPNEIVLTEATRAALAERYSLEAKGTVNLRDKGSLPVYRLTRRAGATE